MSCLCFFRERRDGIRDYGLTPPDRKDWRTEKDFPAPGEEIKGLMVLAKITFIKLQDSPGQKNYN